MLHATANVSFLTLPINHMVVKSYLPVLHIFLCVCVCIIKEIILFFPVLFMYVGRLDLASWYLMEKFEIISFFFHENSVYLVV